LFRRVLDRPVVACEHEDEAKAHQTILSSSLVLVCAGTSRHA
jgi:hypothetical protein